MGNDVEVIIDSSHYGQFPIGQLPLGHSSLLCTVTVRVRTGVSRVWVGSVRLRLGLVGLVLGLELGLGLCFGLGGNVQGEMTDTFIVDGSRTLHDCM